MSFSANLGLLWQDRALPEAIEAAHAAGFAAVELHWPYDVPARKVKAALMRTGLPLISLNTRRGDLSAGENGLAALPGREDAARAAMEEAIAYARMAGAGAVHVMAGVAGGQEAAETFSANLRFACDAAPDLTILIEPLNSHDAPGYFLSRTGQAERIIAAVDRPNLKLMFDCYHVARMEGDVLSRFAALKAHVGHVQFAGVPDRGPPDRGTVDFAALLPQIRELGFSGPFGAEYRPSGTTEASLHWMKTLS